MAAGVGRVDEAVASAHPLALDHVAAIHRSYYTHQRHARSAQLRAVFNANHTGETPDANGRVKLFFLSECRQFLKTGPFRSSKVSSIPVTT